MTATRSFLVHAIRRHASWIAGAVCVLACASLAARTVGHVIEAAYLADPTVAPPLAPVGRPPPPTAPPGGDAQVLVDRNPFCSGCVRAGDPPPLPGGEPATVTLPLALIATQVADDPAASVAAIRHVETGGFGAFRAGDRVPGAGVVERVGPTYALVRTGAGAVARLELLAPVADPAGAAAPDLATAAAVAAPAWADRVRAIDDRTFEVDRSLVRDVVAGQGRGMGVRIAPAVKDGKVAGLRVAGARKDSIAAAIGLRSGDVIQSIDGTALDDAQVALRLYGKLDTAARVQVRIDRRGQPVELEYRLR